jgi:DNA-binding CsgD family transcriptional regulator
LVKIANREYIKGKKGKIQALPGCTSCLATWRNKKIPCGYHNKISCKRRHTCQKSLSHKPNKDTCSLLEDLLPNSGDTTEKDRWDLLSEREQEVLKLVALGHTSAEIAEQLSLSVKTVETYRARGMEKLGLRTRAALVRYALKSGLIAGE